MTQPDCGFDNQIYKWLNKYVVPLFCRLHIHPNYVTLLNMFIVYLLYVHRNSNKYVILGLMMLYALGDCLDGAVARQCDKQSKIGHVLDNISDHANMFIHAYVLLTSRSGYIPNPPIILFMYAITLWFKLGYVSTHMQNPLFKTLHDNTFLSYFAYWLVVYNK